MRWPVDYRKLAVELVEYACGGADGRTEKDPVYRAVTEGRDDGRPHGYSSCGDLAHWMLYRLGVRLPFVNRKEHQGFTYGLNVSRLAFDGLSIHPSPSRPVKRYEPGDIGVIWSNSGGTDAHVFVILDDQQPEALFVGEYGQPGGALHTRRVRYESGGLYIAQRRLHSVLLLNEVINAADVGGMLEPPETASQYATRLELPTLPAPPPEAA